MVLVDASQPRVCRTRLPPEVVATLGPPTWQVSAVAFLTQLGVFRFTGGDIAGCRLPARGCEEVPAFCPLGPGTGSDLG